MIRARASLVSVAIAAAFLSCGEDEDAIRLAEFQNNLQMANATIDSLNYTVESSNLLIDELRARADSLQHVDDKLLASVQKLNREVKKWRRLASEQKRMNQQLTQQIERMKVEKQADKRSIAHLRSQADSLNSALWTPTPAYAGRATTSARSSWIWPKHRMTSPSSSRREIQWSCIWPARGI